MLRLRRLLQLLIALCSMAFLSALISLLIYRVHSMTALSTSGADILNGLKEFDDIDKLREISAVLVRAGYELRDSGAFLVDWGLGFVLIWSFILGLSAVATYRQACKVMVAPDVPETENFIDKALAGKLELVKIFWGGYVTLSLVLLFLTSAALKLLPTMEVDGTSLLINLLVAPIVLSIPMTMQWACAILVWRCAPNTSSVVWSYMAKLIVIATTVIPLIKGIYIIQTIVL